MEQYSKNISEYVAVVHVSPELLRMAAAPPVTSHLSIQEAVFSCSPYLASERQEGGTKGGRGKGGSKK